MSKICLTDVEAVNDEEYEVFDSYFRPKTIAIVGATNSPFSGGFGFLYALVSSEFPKDKIFPINRNRSEVLGVPAYPNLSAVPVPIDYVIIAVPRKHILDVMEECVKKRIKLGTIFTAGFSEVGQPDLESRIVEIAKRGSMRLLGPNCMGLYVPKERVTFMVDLPVGRENSGTIGIISQSGGHANVFSNMGAYRGLKFSKVISFGNGCDLHCPDFFEYLARDPETEIIFIYLEGFKDAQMGQRFYHMASQAIKKKPIILWKGGKTKAGRGAIWSHTGSLAGSNEVVESLINQIGLVEVTNPEEVIDTLNAFYYLKNRLPIGRRLAVVGGGGGNTVSTADILNRAGFELPENPKEVQEELIKVIGEVGVIVRNPLDLNVSTWEERRMRQVLKIVSSLKNIDLLIFDLGIDWGLKFEEAFNLSGMMQPTFKSVLRGLKKIQVPIVAVFPTIFYEGDIVSKKMEIERMVQEFGIPTFSTMTRAAFALKRLVEYGERFRSNQHPSER